MSVPSWYAVALLGLAAWRIWQLLAFDSILDRPRRWALGLGNDWRRQGDAVPNTYRYAWGDFLTCPYCFGFWVSLAWFVAWEISAKWAEIVAVPFAISALVIGLSKILAAPE